MAVAALEFAFARGVGLERKFRDRTAALRTAPVAPEHRTLATCAVPLCAVAVAAEERFRASRVGLERKLSDCRAAPGTGPVARIHRTV